MPSKLTDNILSADLQAIPEKKEKKYKTVKKTIYYQGQAFIIEEEVSLDSDEESSVKTSEDEFEVD